MKFSSSVFLISSLAFACVMEKTIGIAPILAVRTDSVSSISYTSAKMNFGVVSKGRSAIVEAGIVWSSEQVPNFINGKKIGFAFDIGNHQLQIKGLTNGTRYYARAFATDSVKTDYGDVKTFETLSNPPSAVVDIDKNVYDTIRIGLQTWMKQNLRTTSYQNGEPISTTQDNTEWYYSTTGMFLDKDSRPEIWGKVYNEYAIKDARKLCPVGWHLPQDKEWKILLDYLGGSIGAGGKLKTGDGWEYPNTGATNSSGFSAVPAQYADQFGTFAGGIFRTYFWAPGTPYLYKLVLSYGNSNADLQYQSDSSGIGYSVRCVKD